MNAPTQVSERTYKHIKRTLNDVNRNLWAYGYQTFHLEYSNVIIVWNADLIEVASHLPYDISVVNFESFESHVVITPDINAHS